MSGPSRTPATARAATPKLPALTGVRAFAAWWVVLFHAKSQLAPYLPQWTQPVLNAGNWGVDLFFVLSGFVIELNYGDRVHADRASIATFLQRRFARIYPLHFVMLGVAVLYALGVLNQGGHLTPSYDFHYLPAHFLLVQEWGLDPALRWNVPAWSISTELMAYLLFPLMVLVARPRQWRWQVQLAAVALLVALLWLTYRLFGVVELGDAVASIGLARCIIEFEIGVVLCALFLRERERIAASAATAILLGAVLVGAVAVGLRLDAVVFVPVVCALIVFGLALAGTRAGPFGARAAVYLGDISYSTYMAHYLLLVLFKSVFVRAPDGLLPPLPLAGYFALVLAASVAFYHLLELPAQAALLRGFGLARRRGVTVGAP